MNKNIKKKKKKKQTKTAREVSYEKAVRNLKKLVNESRDFTEFKTKLQGSLWWTFGDPMTEAFRSWTWADFQKFYQENKSA